MVSVGVIGGGYWGRKIIGEYLLLSQKNPDVRLTGICDASSKVLEGYKNELDVPLLTTDCCKLLKSPDIDAVHICTPNETHYRICHDALRNGKHVLLEKPMTLYSEEAYKLVDLANELGLVLSVGHIFRFNNALLELRNKVQTGYFGDIRHLRLQWTTLMEPPAGRDIITDLAPHPFDVINHLMDDWPVKLNCFSTFKKSWEELSYIDGELSSGATTHIEISWSLPGKVRRVTILGSDRTADCDCETQDVSIFEGDSKFELPIWRNNTIHDELEHFINSISNNCLDNGFEVKNSAFLGAKVVELIELSKLSMEKGEQVHVPNFDTPRRTMYSVLKDVKVGEGTRIYDHVNLYKCEAGKNCKIDAFVYMEEGVKIGDNCKIRAHTFIPTGVTIEDDVFIGPNVTFTNDKYPRTTGEWKILPILVKRGSSIGAGSVILPGVTIGENAMVGAGSVVTKDVPDNSVVCGNPARVVRVI